jgi:hypothetical protein
MSRVTDEPALPPESAEAPAEPPPRRRFPFAIAAVAVLILAAGLSSSWWLPLVRPAHHDAPAPAEPAPAEPPAPPADSPPPRPDNALAERVDRLQQDLDALKGGSTGAITQGDLQPLRDQLAALSRKLDAPPAVDPQAVAEIADQVKALGTRLAKAEATLGERGAEAHDEQILVLAAGQVQAALADGGPYEPAMELLRAGAKDDAALRFDLAILEKHAKTGLPSRVRLGQDLASLPARLVEPAPAPPEAGFWQRVETRMTNLVTIRRVDDGDKPAAGPPGPDRLIAEAEAQLADGDLAGAIATVKQFDGDAARLAAPWLEQAADRLEAEQTAQSLSASLAKRLGGPADHS